MLVVDLGAGDDQFFGEDGGAFNIVKGGLGDDKILGGNNFGTDDSVTTYGSDTLANGSQILLGGDTLPSIYGFGASEYGFRPDIEDAVHSEVNGDDFIDLGDNNYVNYGFGGGGNDKIIGGGLYTLDQFLFGGDGDDKIFTINPSQRGTALDAYGAGGNYGRAYGNKGMDKLYGSDRNEYLFGDGEYGGKNN